MYRESDAYTTVSGIIMKDTSGSKVAVKNPISGEIFSIREVEGYPYIEMVGPDKTEVVALISEKGYIRTITNGKISAVECFECKANSGAAGAGGFGNYGIDSMTADMEPRQPDDGDIEDDFYTPYSEAITSAGGIPLTFEKFKTPYYYHMSRMIKWVMNADENDFIKNIDRHFNRNYLMDYYLTILLLGGVDSLGKNLMVGTWGPENHLYKADEESLDPTSPFYDKCAFRHTLSNGSTIIVTPTAGRNGCTYSIAGSDSLKTGGTYDYAEDENGRTLYYKEEAYNRYSKSFENNYKDWNSDLVTNIPGECIWYPMFYDIDTICGLDNSGQLIFDVDIEVGDSLDDGTSVYNTADSNLWTRVRDYMGNVGWLADRWSVMRADKFTMSNLVSKYFYTRQIAKIPETYYNEDCMLKYIYEGPKEQKGSGSYLYCIHGSRYEQMKRWYSQRIDYLDSMFGLIGTSNASLRFNYAYYDANYNDGDTTYGSYAELARNKPGSYIYDSASNTLYANKGTEAKPQRGNTIKPISFNFKTYQPGYVGIRWFNGGSVHMNRVKRNETITMTGNVKTSGDAEVFIFGGANIKDIGNMAPYNVKQIDFRNLTKLNKLIIGDTGYSSVIEKLDLGTNSYLSELNLTNCTTLSTLNVSNCKNLKTINLTGSGVTSVTLASGGALESISYSSAITSINLQNFTNLSTINVSNLNNLNEFVIKNCPKILGTSQSYNARAWNLLQQTSAASALNNIEVTSYGEVAPKSTASDENFFFPNKYYSYNTAKNIKGEITYTGTVIPSNYAKFATAYPKLKITYTNISDASEMFANYSNLNCISKITVYTGVDNYGTAQYSTAYYWTDTRKSDFPSISTETSYSDGTKFYSANGIVYRMLYCYDDKDLDVLRAEIKESLSNFAGTTFTNISGMFRNIDILDYIDPDTFNSIDISKADTSDMFSGCTNLRYFIAPNDVVKNDLVYLYYNIIDGKEEETTYEEWNENTGVKHEKTDSNGNLIYSNPFTKEETISKTSIYPKGIRKYNENMFYNCKKARIFIRKVSNNDIININSSAFKYVCYDPSLESQPRGITGERPAILFEHNEIDLLSTTTEPVHLEGTSTFINNKDTGTVNSDGNRLYYSVNPTTYEREFNASNTYILLNSTTWMREVYFGVKEIVINDTTSLGGYKLAYALDNSNNKILFRAQFTGTTLASFNDISNSLKLISLTQSSLSDISTDLTAVSIPVPVYDCFDNNISRQQYEKSIVGLFTEDNFTDGTETSIAKIQPANMTILNIIDTETIPEYTCAYMTNLTTVSVDGTTKYINSAAFTKCSALKTFRFKSGNSTPLSMYSKIERIGASAFAETGLTSVSFSSTLTSIGAMAFSKCTSLQSLGLGGNITYIPVSLCEGCTSLDDISGISKDLTEIDDSAFKECTRLNVLDTNGGVTFAPSWSARDKDGEIVTGQYNFNGFSKLKRIGKEAFYKVNTISGKLPTTTKDSNGVSITTYPDLKLQFNDSIKEIGESAFYQDLNRTSSVFVELVWGNYTEETLGYPKEEKLVSEGDFHNLVIGSGAFRNIRFAWRPETPIIEDDTEKYRLTTDILYLPKINTIGGTAFSARDTESKFKYCICKNSDEEIGSEWVSNTNKIIFSYYGTKTADSFTYLLSHHDDDYYAYLYHANTVRANLVINKTVSFGDNQEYKFIQIMSGAFSDNPNAISNVTFMSDCVLKLIESNVLQSENLTNIRIQDVNTMNFTNNVIPAGLTIEAGNKFKNTNWWTSLTTSTSKGPVILGRYIMGYVFEKNQNEEAIEDIDVDLSDTKSSSGVICDTVYDNAFSDTKITGINLGSNIKYIYDNAFSGCSGITELALPSCIETIGDYAFKGISIKNLYLPKSIKTIGNGAFDAVDKQFGTINSIFIEDGAKIEGNPFSVISEIKTGVTDPSTANVTIKSLHIPSIMENILSTSFTGFKQLSQITNLTIGELKVAPDGSYNYPNYPLYTDGDGNTKIAFSGTVPSGYSQNTNNGKNLYCPAFYADLAAETGYEGSYLTTTNATGYYPLGDNSTYGGYKKDLDISFIMRYSNMSQGDGMRALTDTENAAIVDLTEEDIMRIIAGFSSDGENRTISIRLTDYNKLNAISREIITQKFNITLKLYTNK